MTSFYSSTDSNLFSIKKIVKYWEFLGKNHFSPLKWLITLKCWWSSGSRSRHWPAHPHQTVKYDNIVISLNIKTPPSALGSDISSLVYLPSCINAASSPEVQHCWRSRCCMLAQTGMWGIWRPGESSRRFFTAQVNIAETYQQQTPVLGWCCGGWWCWRPDRPRTVTFRNDRAHAGVLPAGGVLMPLTESGSHTKFWTNKRVFGTAAVAQGHGCFSAPTSPTATSNPERWKTKLGYFNRLLADRPMFTCL